METNYTVLGGDGQQYGPVSLDQIKAWVKEGRIDGSTQLLPAGANAWITAAQIPELNITPPPPLMATNTPPPLSGTSQPLEVAILQRQMRIGADWCFWIAGFSLVNFAMSFGGGGFFLVGLGLPTIIEQVFHSITGVGFTLVVALIVTAIFVVLGVFGRKGQTWAFMVAIGIYLVDTLVCLGLSLGTLIILFHLWVLFSLGRGMVANFKLRKLLRNDQY